MSLAGAIQQMMPRRLRRAGYRRQKASIAERAPLGALARIVTGIAAEQLRVRFKTSSRITKLSQHEANGREFQERKGVAVEIFPVLGEAAATVEPRNGAFDNPTLG